MDHPPDKKPLQPRLGDEEEDAADFRQMLAQYIRDLRALIDRPRRKLN
jgi:hypothetical protein